MKAQLWGLALAAALIVPAEASKLTYSLDIQEANFSITGTITTDGTIGALSNRDVRAYDLTVPGIPTVQCSVACYAHDDIGSFQYSSGPALFATPNLLLFNFAAENSNGIILGQNTYPSDYVEFYDHFLIGDTGAADDEGPGGIQVGSGDGHASARTVLYPGLGNLQEYSSDGTYVLGVSATPLPRTFSLFFGGLGVLGLLVWRRRANHFSMSASSTPSVDCCSVRVSLRRLSRPNGLELSHRADPRCQRNGKRIIACRTGADCGRCSCGRSPVVTAL